MDAVTALKERRSVRKFAGKPVSKEMIEQVVDCGRLAATARNVQPWEFVVVTDQGTRDEIARLADYGKFISSAPVCIAVFCQRDAKYYLEDGSAATQNILVAATALGLASCWVAGDKKEYAEKVRELLGVPDRYTLVSMVAVGYPDGPAPSPKKRGLDEVLHWEKF
ncbi:MAG: nitroreductase family protein [Peptococcaceae bacterium]|nr:nitroreductase family protein [Peptococcaceae bacterium]